MRQIWLHSNRRAIAAGFLVPVFLTIIAAIIIVWPHAGWWRVAAILLLVVAGMTAWSLSRMLQQPRLAYDDGHMLVYLSGSFVPERIPVEVVECFFMGQAPSLLPQGKQAEQPSRAQAIIVRLAESAVEWHHRPVRPQLGQWCDGYITVRGTWSEPISPALVQELNKRLVAAHRERRPPQDQVT